MPKITKPQIKSELHRLAGIIGATPELFPTIENSRDAWPNISFSSDGTVYYEAHERGDELFSIPALDLEHLMFMSFKDITFSIAVEYELQNRKPSEDFRIQLFSKQIDLMQTLNSEWAKRIRKEIDTILRNDSIDDQHQTKKDNL